MKKLNLLISVFLIFFMVPFVHAAQFGPIASSDTLWSIASKSKPKNMTIGQYMDKILKKNPHAFQNNNINKIIEGSYLNLSVTIPKTINQPDHKANITVKKVDKVKTNNPPNLPTKVISTPSPIIPPILNAKTITKKTVSNTHLIETPKTTKKKKRKRQKVTWSYDASSSYDDNIRLSQKESDKRDDLIFHGIVKATTSFRMSKLSKVSLAVTLQQNTHKTFSLLDSTHYSFNSRYIFSTATNYFSPLYIIKLDIGGIESKSEMRQANVLKLGLDINKRISNKITLTTGLQYQSQDSQSKVFDTKKMILFANVDYSFNRRNLIYGTYHYINGDVVSSSTPSLDVVDAATEIEADDAFGGVDLNQFAYKIDSKSHVFTFGYNYFKSRPLSFDVSARYVLSESNDDASLSYERLIIRAGILGRF